MNKKMMMGSRGMGGKGGGGGYGVRESRQEDRGQMAMRGEREMMEKRWMEGGGCWPSCPAGCYWCSWQQDGNHCRIQSQQQNGYLVLFCLIQGCDFFRINPEFRLT